MSEAVSDALEEAIKRSWASRSETTRQAIARIPG